MMILTKRLRYLILLAAAAMLAACTKEPLEPAGGGDGAPVEVSFDVGVRNVLTKADSTPFDDASGTFLLYVAAFDKTDGTLAESSLIGGEGFQPVGTLKDGTASIHLRLPHSQEYRIVFFAQREGAYKPYFSKNSARFGFVPGRENPANDPSMDAFYAAIDVTAAKATHEITLKRPFAQLNVLVPVDNVPEGQTAFKSSMKVKIPILFDLLAGKAGETLAEVEFTENAIAADPFGKYAQTHKWVGTNYVFVPESGKVEVTSFREAGMAAAVAPGEVPVKVNGRTNLVGKLYGADADVDLAFTVVVDSNFGGEEESPVGEDTPAPGPAGAGDFVRLTDAADLAEGDEIIIVYEDGSDSVAMGPPSDNGNFRQCVSVTIDGDKITNPDPSIQIVSLEESEYQDWWYLAVDGGYLAAQETKNNYLVTTTEQDVYSLWTFEFDEDGLWLYAGDGDSRLLCYNLNYPRFSCYDLYNPQELVSVFVRHGSNDKSEKILSHTEFGCHLADHTWDYAAGTDQYVREYDGDALTFVLMNPGNKEQMVITGYSSTMKAGDAVTITVGWKKGLTEVLDKTYEMKVVAEENKKVWIADQKGYGFVIKK